MLVFLILFWTLVPATGARAAPFPSFQQLANAAFYIENMYNSHVGLVTESEDNGTNVNSTPATRTFWIYSDNLWASEALKPFYPQTAANISYTIASYIGHYGESLLFEVVLGKQIPNLIHAHRNVNAANLTIDGKDYSIWLDRHNATDGGIFYDANRYADLDFYLSLDNYLGGNLTASEWWFRQGEAIWDGHGFYDKAAQQLQRYQNYKLGLYLFTAKATGFVSPIYNLVEPTAWSYQKPNGGIASQSYLNGTINGTANVETTSILLLGYDRGLLRTWQRLWQTSSGLLLMFYLTAATAGIIVAGAFFLLALKRRSAHSHPETLGEHRGVSLSQV